MGPKIIDCSEVNSNNWEFIEMGDKLEAASVLSSI